MIRFLLYGLSGRMGPLSFPASKPIAARLE
jgi:hypothetical protein